MRGFHPIGLAVPLESPTGRAISSVVVEPSYVVSGFTDSIYFQGPSGSGRGVLGTIRIVGRLLSVPAGSQRIVIGRAEPSGILGGWYLPTGLSAGGINLVHRITGATKISPTYTFVGGDVGSVFVLHGTADSSYLRLYMGGAEVGSGTAMGAAPAAALVTDALTIGRFQHVPGLSNPHVGLIDVAISPTVMTAAEIAADAAKIMGRSHHLSLPSIPGEDQRFTARDLVTVADWHDRDGDDCTLTRTGSPTLAELT